MSSDIRPWPISQPCREQSARLGFDPDNPEQMIAVRNAEAEELLALINGGAAPKGSILSLLKFNVALVALLAVSPDIAGADIYAVPEKLTPSMVAQFPLDPPSWTPTVKPVLQDAKKSAKQAAFVPFIIENRYGDHHPSLIIKPPLLPATSKTTSAPENTLNAQSMIPVIWAAFPQLLLAAAALLIWRELRAMRRGDASVELNEEPKHEETDMDAEVTDDQEFEVLTSPWRVLVGGASHCGQVRKENQDAYAVREISDGIALAITCDGVGGRPGGRTASRYCSRKLKARITMGLTIGLSAEDALLDALDHCAEQMEEDGIEGLTTALVALVDGDRLTWAGLGDGRICVIHSDGMAQDLMAPHHAPNLPSNVITAHLEAGRSFTPRLGALRLEPGALILTMSDGAGDLLDLHGLAGRRKQLVKQVRKAGPEIFCDNLLSHLESLTEKETDQLLHSDNLTLTVALIELEEDAK